MGGELSDNAAALRQLRLSPSSDTSPGGGVRHPSCPRLLAAHALGCPPTTAIAGKLPPRPSWTSVGGELGSNGAATGRLRLAPSIVTSPLGGVRHPSPWVLLGSQGIGVLSTPALRLASPLGSSCCLLMLMLLLLLLLLLEVLLLFRCIDGATAGGLRAAELC